MVTDIQYSRFELARILGARALQLSMGAPPLVKTKEIDPIRVAREELAKDVIPITVIRD